MIALPWEVEAESKKNMPLDYDDHEGWGLYFTDSDEELRIEFNLDEGTAVDVYIMTTEEYNNYKNGQPFSASFSQENTTGFDKKWKQPSDQNYNIVVDNWDNEHSTDAVPTGDVVYDIKYDEDWDEMEDWLEAMGYTVMVCCGLIIALILVIIILIVKKNKGDTVVRVTGTPPPSASYPQPSSYVPPPAYQSPPPQPYIPETSNEPPPPPQMPPAYPPPQYQQPYQPPAGPPPQQHQPGPPPQQPPSPPPQYHQQMPPSPGAMDQGRYGQQRPPQRPE